MAKLSPRDSDADVHDGKMILETGTETVESELNTLDFDDHGFRDPSCASLKHPPVKLPLLRSSRLSHGSRTPTGTSQSAAGGMSALIMHIFTHYPNSGASFFFQLLYRPVWLANFWLDSCGGTVKDIYLDTWDFVAPLISKAAACNKLHLFIGPAFRYFISDGVARFDQTVLSLLRTQTLCHIILNVGILLSRANSTGVKAPSLYLPPLLQTMLTNTLTPL